MSQPRLHVMIQTQDLDTSIRFYSAMLGHEPTMRKGDYAKWHLDSPSINLSVSDRSGRVGLEHLGVEVDGEEALAALEARVAVVGEVDEEGETVCCYHRSKKGWSRDPNGIDWELFFSHGTSEEYGDQTPGRACCDPTQACETGSECSDTACCDAA